MKQSKAMSMVESVANIAVGFGISLWAQWYFLPLLGVTIALRQNLMFALIMTVISIARSYGMRRVFEALHTRRPMTAFEQAVLAEVLRQQQSEGYSAAHDDKYDAGELARAGACYLLLAGKGDAFPTPPIMWPWGENFWNPKDIRRDLARGCALGIAEGNKLDRARKRRGGTS